LDGAKQTEETEVVEEVARRLRVFYRGMRRAAGRFARSNAPESVMSMRSPPRLVALAGVALGLLSRPSWACDCSPPAIGSLHAHPVGSRPVPRNAHAWVISEWPDASRASADAARSYLASAVLHITQRANDAAPGGGEAAVMFDRKDFEVYGAAVAELVPRAPFDPGAAGKVSIERELTDTLSTFTVGDRIDTEAPDWDGLGKGTIAFSFDPCGSGVRAHFVALDLDDDDVGVGSWLRWNVWIARGDTPIDYGTPPAAVLHGDEHDADAHARWGSCQPVGNFPMPGDGETMRVGIRIADVAGRLSPPSEARVIGIGANATNVKRPVQPLSPMWQTKLRRRLRQPWARALAMTAALGATAAWAIWRTRRTARVPPLR
jgi:hypothetical protein